MMPAILYEDNHVLAVDKPSGLLTQGDITGAPSLMDVLKRFIKKRDSKPGNVFLGMVQRLDRPVSGVIVFAKTSKAASRISAQIRQREVTKLYLALSVFPEKGERPCFDWQEYRHYLTRVKDKTLVAGGPGAKGQLGVLRVKALCSDNRAGLYLVRLITGRKHQIRAQMAHLGCPLSGDTKYGSKTVFPINDGIGLHACYCGMRHPVKPERLEIRSDIPEVLLGQFSSQKRAAALKMLDLEIQHLNG